MATLKIPSFDYDRMSRATLIKHCKAYSEAIHELAREIQRFHYLEKARRVSREFFHGRVRRVKRAA